SVKTRVGVAFVTGLHVRSIGELGVLAKLYLGPAMTALVDFSNLLLVEMVGGPVAVVVWLGVPCREEHDALVLFAQRRNRLGSTRRLASNEQDLAAAIVVGSNIGPGSLCRKSPWRRRGPGISASGLLPVRCGSCAPAYNEK